MPKLNFQGISSLKKAKTPPSHFATQSFKFIVGAEAKEFYLTRGLVSQLSKPLNTLINGGMRESREGCVVWEDVEVDIFLRFIQFAYTGSYHHFKPKLLPPSPTEEAASLTAKVVENFMDHISPKGGAKEPVVIDMTDDAVATTATASRVVTSAAAADASATASGPRPSTENQGGPSTAAGSSRNSSNNIEIMADFDFDQFLTMPSLTPPPPPTHNEKKDAFKLPYSLASYKQAAAEWLGGRNHSSRCRRGASSYSAATPTATARLAARLAAKRKLEAISCDCDVGSEGTPSERKRDFISAFMAKESPALGYDRTSLNRTLQDDEILPTRLSFEPVFVGHARLWVFADRYAITALMDLACGHLVHELSHWTMYRESFVSEFGDLLRYVYDNTVAGCQLRLLVAQFAACVVEDVTAMEEWVAMLNDVPDFAGDLINQLMNRLA